MILRGETTSPRSSHRTALVQRHRPRVSACLAGAERVANRHRSERASVQGDSDAGRRTTQAPGHHQRPSCHTSSHGRRPQFAHLFASVIHILLFGWLPVSNGSPPRLAAGPGFASRVVSGHLIGTESGFGRCLEASVILLVWTRRGRKKAQLSARSDPWWRSLGGHVDLGMSSWLRIGCECGSRRCHCPCGVG